MPESVFVPKAEHAESVLAAYDAHADVYEAWWATLDKAKEEIGFGLIWRKPSGDRPARIIGLSFDAEMDENGEPRRDGDDSMPFYRRKVIYKEPPPGWRMLSGDHYWTPLKEKSPGGKKPEAVAAREWLASKQPPVSPAIVVCKAYGVPGIVDEVERRENENGSHMIYFPGVTKVNGHLYVAIGTPDPDWDGGEFFERGKMSEFYADKEAADAAKKETVDA